MTELDQYKAHVAMLTECLQTFIDEHEECTDADDWMASMCSLEAVHVASETLSNTPADSYEEVKKLRDEIAKLQSERDALKVAKDALNIAADKFHDYAEIHAAKEASPENDIKVERNLMLSSDMDKALAKINEVLK